MAGAEERDAARGERRATETGPGALLLVRHATPAIDPARPAAEWPLSEEGRRRARALAARLARWRPRALISSQEPKAAETAEILAAALAIPWHAAPGLQEHARRAAAFQARREEFEGRVAPLFAHPAERVFGEESADEAHARYSAAIDRALARHPAGTLAVVTHGTVMALFVARATGQEPFALWRRLQRLGTPAVVALARPRLEVLALEGVGPEP